MAEDQTNELEIIEEETIEEETIEEEMTEETSLKEENGILLQQVMSRADYSALRAHYMYEVKPGRMKRLIIGLAIVSILSMAGRVGYIPAPLYYVGVCGLIVLTFVFILIDADARKLEKPGKSIGNRPQNLLLSEDGFQVEWLNYGVPLEYKWDTVIVAGEGEYHYFLYVAKLAAIIIPKRGIKPEKLAAVHELLERKTNLMKYDESKKRPQQQK